MNAGYHTIIKRNTIKKKKMNRNVMAIHVCMYVLNVVSR